MAVAAVAIIAWNGAAHADGGQRAESLPALVPLEPIAVPIVDHGEMLGRLELRAMWRSEEADGSALAQSRLPQLRAALVEAAADHARLVATPSRPIDPSALAASLGQAAGRAGFTGDLLVLEASARSG